MDYQLRDELCFIFNGKYPDLMKKIEEIIEIVDLPPSNFSVLDFGDLRPPMT